MTTMKAVCLKKYGEPEEMYWGEVPKLEAGEKELLIKVQATALNRADIQQRLGKYPPPPGSSEILGLEVTGVVEAIGANCDAKWKIGDRIASLLVGGGYAEYCVIPQELAIVLPNEINVIDAATIPEAWMTAYQVLYFVAKIEEIRPEFVLIHAGASSVGIAATQLALEFGSKPIVTCGSQEKVDFCLNSVGAFAAINYKEQDFVERVKEITSGKGAGIIIDCVGGSYFMRNLESIQSEGRLVLIGWLGGSQVPNCDLSMILRKRVRIEGSTLRARDLSYKAALTQKITEHCLPRFLNGRFKLFVDCVFPIQQIQEAHKYMEADKNKGKIVVTM